MGGEVVSLSTRNHLLKVDSPTPWRPVMNIARFPPQTLQTEGMGKKCLLGLVILLVAVFGGKMWFATRSTEPAYGGRLLSAWLLDSQEHRQIGEQNRLAILQIGTNAIPELVWMAGVRDAPLEKKMASLVRGLAIPIKLRTADDYHEMGTLEFYVLQSRGRTAVPDLVDLLKSNDPEVRGTAADCLGNIGPDARAAIPLLVRFLDDTHRIVRVDATINLGRIHMEPGVVVPALIAKLNVSNSILPTTIGTLSQFGMEAKAAAPILRELLRKTNVYPDYVRSEATNALRQIDPDTTTGGRK
ncbi:MAG TPA: HEAT repeat domain-containing protein [Candidatus Saccharimonadales bacterium]|nr:HEAT repeat domain-containing protein [Candidatus Saccharimonadales bacterium]